MASEKHITFPNDPILVGMLESSKLTEEVIIKDAYGFDKTYAELLADIHATRHAIQEILPPSAFTSKGLVTEQYQYIGALTRGMIRAYTRPFLLRILREGEAIPYTVSQKPLAREIVRQYFAPTGIWDSGVPTAGVEVWGSSLATLNRFIPDKLLEHSLKPWDWAGVQMASY
ncbi:hypothetical protein MY10362_007506 [Beauveria mimosiformis]